MNNHFQRNIIQNWAFTCIWGVLITIVSLLPMWKYPSNVSSFSDKMGHFSVYLILSMLMIRSLRNTSTLSFRKNFVFTLILCGGYGILIELLQLVVPGRMADVNDALANVSGVVCGGILVRMVLW